MAIPSRQGIRKIRKKKDSTDWVEEIVSADMIAEAMGQTPILPTPLPTTDTTYERELLRDRLERSRLRRITEDLRSSQTFDQINYTVSQQRKLIEIKNRGGQLEEFMLLAPSTGFSIRIRIDDTQVMDRSYTQLAARSNYSNIITAYYDAISLVYVVNLSEFRWEKSFELSIIVAGTTSITFSEVFALWHIYDELST